MLTIVSYGVKTRAGAMKLLPLIRLCKIGLRSLAKIWLIIRHVLKLVGWCGFRPRSRIEQIQHLLIVHIK